MKPAQNIAELSQRLERSLASDSFPPRYRALATQLLNQVKKPPQLSVAGLPGSGKTSLIRMLLGGAHLSALSGANIVEIAYGPEEKTILEYADGRREEIKGTTPALPASDDVFRMVLLLPEERLLTQCFAEVTLSGSADFDGNTLKYLADTSALVIWTSELFGPMEQTLWSNMPDHVKDHSFLALTKADQHQMKGDLTERIASLEEFVSEEFYGLYPVATLQALKARGGAGAESERLWNLSGGKSLHDAVEQLVAVGRAEDIDRAVALLQVAGEDLRLAERETGAPRGSAVAQPGPHDAQGGVGLASTKQGEQALSRTLRQLQSSAEKLLAVSNASSPPDYAFIIESCIETIEDITEILAGVADEDASVKDFLGDTQEGQDMLFLLQLEKNHEAAADAVSLMVQLKKEAAARAGS